jgi:hypothetical protein
VASGYCLHQQLALLQSRILRYQPDHVILIDGYNDFILRFRLGGTHPRAALVLDIDPGGFELSELWSSLPVTLEQKPGQGQRFRLQAGQRLDRDFISLYNHVRENPAAVFDDGRIAIRTRERRH